MNAKIVALANLKGGAGKSTTTINLAVAAEQQGIPTAIIDIDPEQQASARWKDGRSAPRPEVLSAVHTRLPQSVMDAQRTASLILIDCPALVPAITAEAVKIADLVLIPCRTTVQDLQFLPTTIDIAADKQKPAVILLNAVEAQLKETEQARAFINSKGFALAPLSLSKAVAYHRSITAGLGVTEFEPNGKAAQEILSLLDWISRLLHLSNTRLVDEPMKIATLSGKP
ncbi:MAG: ParA family protein [Acidobacteriaceae bacterium]|nr:ParA family protein [Acidobacteriaceae bacterium]